MKEPSIDADDAKLDTTLLEEILQQVKDDANVKKLSLRHAGVTPSLAVHLADFLEENSSLTEVDLSGNHLGEHGAACLATSLAKNKTVKSLVLADCGLAADALAEWVSFFRDGVNTSLQHLNLAGNQIDDDGAEALGVMLQTAQTRRMHFDLRRNELTTAGIQVLAEAMKASCPTAVTEIQLANNQDQDDPTAAVYRSRVEFYLRRNKTAIERATMLYTLKQVELSSLSVEVCHLSHVVLSIADVTLLAAGLRHNRSVIDLRLEDNALPEEGACRIFRALSRNSSVYILSLLDNNIGDGGFRALSDLLRVPTTAIQSVTVSNPPDFSLDVGLQVMEPRTASSFHYTLANYTLLTSLALGNCGLDDRLASVLVAGIAWSGRIESLNLQRNSFGDRIVFALLRMLQRCLRLQRLDLSGNCFSLDGLLPLLPAISTHPQLRKLLLGRFHQTTTSAVNQFVHALQQSETLVQLELKTTERRSRTDEAVEKLNARLKQRNEAAMLAKERQWQAQRLESHRLQCRKRAAVQQLARALVSHCTSAATRVPAVSEAGAAEGATP